MILDNYEEFLTKILTKLKELGIDVSALEMDHFGYQVSSNENYDKLKIEFNHIGQEVSEVSVNTRRVGMYKPD